MADEYSEQCPHSELIEALAQDQLEGPRRREAEVILEQSERCRELYRQLTAGRYPRLPNYTVVGQVGKGGFGVVYKAIHHAKERTEALKVLFSKTPLLTSYFQNEVHLIARLRHPNIAILYDAQLATPPLYYTMEFVEGERLNDYLKRNEASLAARIDIIKTVAQAVDYAHRQGVVHRDLKPQNILMDQEGQPHIVDFGIAKKLALVEAQPGEEVEQASKNHEGPVGTLGYIAPEQEKGGAIDARADIFALGALLFHCVTGEPARLAAVPDQRIRILRERQVPQPEDLAAVIGRCVEQTPDDRYATCTDFVADLDNYLTGRPIEAREDHTWFSQTVRIAALVMRESPLTVRTAVLILVAAFLTWYFWAVETLPFGGGQAASKTVMVGFTEGTLEAIEEGCIGQDLPGLSVHDSKSWRMLYGRLMERLALADPLVVVWDGWIADCSDYDDYLIEGMLALRSKAPIVVGAQQFDINGEPRICEAVREVISGYGSIFGAEAGKHRNAYELAYCIQRGFERPIPGLALAAFAAYRFPNCTPEIKLDTETRQMQLRYRKRDPQPGELNYERREDYFPVHRIETAKASGGPLSLFILQGRLEEDDKVAHVYVKARPNAYWASDARTLAFEEILAPSTTPRQLRDWFDDRAVVVGHMWGSKDRHLRGNGEEIYGCQVHAEALDELLARVKHHRFSRRELAARNVIWCGVAVLAVTLLRPRNWRSLRWVTAGCAGLFLLGVAIGGQAGISVNERWLLEPLIALTCLLTAGSLAYWTKAVRERQLRLAPSAATLSTEGPTLASTILAETR